MKPACSELVARLKASVDRNRAGALLLSGGLDSTVLASILCPEYSVAAGLGPGAPDLAFARQAGQKYSKNHIEEVFDEERMAEMVDAVVQTFKTFDPIEIRNSCVALAGLERAKCDGYSMVMTGDGGDELFAGYNYLSRYYGDLKRLEQEMERLWEVMHFSSRTLGEKIGVEISTPFLDSAFAQFAKSIDAGEKIGDHGGQTYGKFILRRCFEPEIGPLAWRAKMAQEQGAATDRFHDFIEKMIDDTTYANKVQIAASEGVRIRSKEHLNYYAIFRGYFPPPKEDSTGCGSVCPECRACLKGGFCRTCGAFPVTPVSP